MSRMVRLRSGCTEKRNTTLSKWCSGLLRSLQIRPLNCSCIRQLSLVSTLSILSYLVLSSGFREPVLPSVTTDHKSTQFITKSQLRQSQRCHEHKPDQILNQRNEGPPFQAFRWEKLARCNLMKTDRILNARQHNSNHSFTMVE